MEDDVVNEFMSYLKDQGGKPVLIDIKPDSISVDGVNSKRHFVNDALRGELNLNPNIDEWEHYQSVLAQYVPVLSKGFDAKSLEFPVVIKWDVASLNFLRKDSFKFIEGFIRNMRKNNVVSVFYGVSGNEELLAKIKSICIPVNKSKELSFMLFSKGDAEEVIELIMELLPKTIDNPGADYYEKMAFDLVSVFVNAIDCVKPQYTLHDILAAITHQPYTDELLSALPEYSKERKDLEELIMRYPNGESGQMDFKKLSSDAGGIIGRMALCLKKSGII